jgi:hypothetical protein
MMGDEPYSFVVHSHELYNMGHLYEAAVAYFQATGKDKLLKVAEMNAQHVNRVFFEGDPNYNGGEPVNQAPGHEEIELALVKLSRATGKPLYLEMADKFLAIRGRTYVPEGEGVMAPTYAQQHAPVEEQMAPAGHAVRAAYLYSAMADVGVLRGRQEYIHALDAIWRNIVDTRMHITGGLGAVHGIEGFGPEYVLPNKEAYNETCAAVGNVLMNWRLFLLHGDAKYLDVAEVALFNNVLAGVNLEGNRFFYVNPLEADGETKFNHGSAGRKEWFGTACCPTNLARLIPQISGMAYAQKGDAIYCTMYVGSETTIALPGGGGGVKLVQETAYPNEGTVRITVTPEGEQRFALKLRIPTWTTDRSVPGGLYRYASPPEGPGWTLTVNGQPVEASVESGFATIHRQWREGDVVELNLAMPVRLSGCDDRVEANRNRVAVTRGPLVFCAEEADNGPVQALALPGGGMKGLAGVELGGEVGVIDLAGHDVVSITLPAAGEKRIALIPYYAWNNRGEGSMIVWLPVGQE